MPDRTFTDEPDPAAPMHERADHARETAQTVDGAAWLLDLSDDDLTRGAHENVLLETFRHLGICTVLARDLRALAAEFELTGEAMREKLETAIRTHDEQQDRLRNPAQTTKDEYLEKQAAARAR